MCYRIFIRAGVTVDCDETSIIIQKLLNIIIFIVKNLKKNQATALIFFLNN